MSDFVEDPAGIFASDAHRHVLGHLSTPSDDYGWSLDALEGRLQPLVNDREDISTILDDLVKDDLAENINGSYRQTAKGHEVLTGPIANEPGPDETPQGPAVVQRATPINRGPNV